MIRGSINSYYNIHVNINVSIWWIFVFCKSLFHVEMWWGDLLYGMFFTR